MSSWKRSFKPHRVASNMRDGTDVFLYHREGDSFPLPQQVVRGKRTPVSRLAQAVLPQGGKRSNRPGILLALAFPTIGFSVIYAFYSSASSPQGEFSRALDIEGAIKERSEAKTV